MARAVFLWLVFAAASCAPRAAPPDPPAGSGGAGMMGPMVGGGMGMMGSGGQMASMRELMDWMNGGELSGSPTEPRPIEDAELLAQGARFHGERCAVCHGEKGDGNGREAGRLSPRPRDFTGGVYELRSTPTGSLPTDVDLFSTISRGMHGTAMLPWVSLSERDRWALVAYLKSLSPRFAEERPASAVTQPSAPPETQALVEKGGGVFQRVQCASCHGTAGHGDGPSVPTLRDDHGQPVRPPDFALGRFKRGTRMEDLYLTLHTGLDGSPMPSYDGALTPADTWALAAYVRSLVAERPKNGGMMCAMMGGGADPQERLGMMIDMPGMPSNMGGMRMGR